MKVYINRKILVGFITSFVIILGLGVASYLYFNEFIQITRWASHARRVLYHAEQVRALAVEFETSQRGFGLTGNELFTASFQDAVVKIHQDMHELDSLTSDNAIQVQRMKKLRDLVESRIAFSQSVMQARKESFEKARDLVQTLEGVKKMAAIRQALDDIQNEENNLVTIRSLDARNEFVLFIYTSSGLIISTLVVLFVLTWQINTNLKSRTLAEENLRQAEQEALRANKELEGFSYSVSHDLRAPLRSIDGYAQILKEDYSGKLDEEGNRLIGVITANAKRMGQLIDDLLDFSRVGRQEIRKTSINMDEFVKPIISELTEFQKDRNIALDIKTLGTSKADVSMIRQVWVNLLSNAIKYSQKKDVAQIEVGAQDRLTETVFYVKDNGVGFDMQYGHKLFGVFQRLHKAKDFEGTGVGLALVKRIVERHNGRIWAEAKLNEGATFYFSLPKQ